MENSTTLSLIAILISIIALTQSFVAHKSTVISEIKKELSDRAKECNKFIIAGKQGHPNINAEISAIVTSIEYAKHQLEIQYKNHRLLLLTYNQGDFIRYFYFQLNTSINELIKHPLKISDYDPSTSPQIEKQHLKCRKFLQGIIEERLEKV